MKYAGYVAAIGLLLGGRMAPAATIAGVIVDDVTGAPLPKSQVTVFGLRPLGIRVPDIMVPDIMAPANHPEALPVKDDGSFQVSDLAPGGHTVIAGCPGYVYTEVRVNIASQRLYTFGWRLSERSRDN